METGRDEVAEAFFQQTLRCRDVEKPEYDRLHPFYADPKNPKDTKRIELAVVWTDLASCYRRQGKLTAAVLAYNHASDVSSAHLHTAALCSWAQGAFQCARSILLGLYTEFLKIKCLTKKNSRDNCACCFS